MPNRRRLSERVRPIVQYPLSRRSRNQFVQLLADGIRSHGVASQGLDILSVRLPKYPDATVLHWPENLFLRNRQPSMLLSARLLAYLERSRDEGAPTVWFLHNILPPKFFDSGPLDRLLNVVDGFVFLTDASKSRFQELPTRPSIVIPHLRYAPGKARVAKRSPDAVLLWDRSEYESRRSLLRGVRCSVWVRSGDVDAGHSGTFVLPRRASETELNEVLARGTIVVIESFRINSGMVFHAVSKGARVLVLSSPESEEVANSIGREWVDTFCKAEWPEHAFFKSLAPGLTPALYGRDPSDVAKQLLDFIRACSTA